MTYRFCTTMRILSALPCLFSHGCGQLIGESFDGYLLKDAEAADTGRPDGDVPDGEVPDSGVDAEVPDSEVPDSQVPDSEVPDSQVPDSEVPDAGVDTGVPSVEVVRLGLEAGCEPGGLPTVYRFDTDLEGWRLDKSSLDTPSGQSIAHEATIGSPDVGALRLQTFFNGFAQSSRVEVRLTPPAAIRCISARIFVPKGSLSHDITDENAGAWLLYVLSGSCHAQAGRVPGMYWREIRQVDQWYEVSWNVRDFMGDGCTLKRDAVEVVGVGVSGGDDVNSSRPLSSPVFIDTVTLWH